MNGGNTMKSTVVNYVDFENIPVPEKLLTIEIPSWDQVAQPMVDMTLSKYNELLGESETELTDEMVQILNIPGMQSVHQVKQLGMDTYVQSEIQRRYVHDVFPYVLSFYRESSNPIVDPSERDGYIEEYVDQVKAYAKEEGLSFNAYVRDRLQLEGPAQEVIETQALEDFIFKLICHDMFERSGLPLDEESYEAFIQDQVIHKQVDEIDLRQELPYQRYIKIMPEMTMSQELFNYFSQQFSVKINPHAPLNVPQQP